MKPNELEDVRHPNWSRETQDKSTQTSDTLISHVGNENFDSSSEIILAIAHQYEELDKIRSSLDTIAWAHKAVFPKTTKEFRKQRRCENQIQKKLTKAQKRYAKTKERHQLKLGLSDVAQVPVTQYRKQDWLLPNLVYKDTDKLVLRKYRKLITTNKFVEATSLKQHIEQTWQANTKTSHT